MPSAVVARDGRRPGRSRQQPRRAPHAWPRAASGQIRLRTLPPVDEALRLVRHDRVRDLAFDDHTGDIGEEEQALGAEPDRERRGRLVGVHVHRPVCERRDDGNPAGGERVEDRLLCRRDWSPDMAELRILIAARTPSGRGSACGPMAALISALTAASDSRTTSSAAALVTRLHSSTNSTGSPRRSSSSEICGPAPWTTTTWWRLWATRGVHPGRGVGGDGAADLDDDEAHVR